MTQWTARILEAGDSALVLQIEIGDPSTLQAVIDVDVNASVIAIAGAVKQRAIAGVRDVVSTFRSVTVFFDPLSTDVAAVVAALHEDLNVTPALSATSIHVCFGQLSH